MKLVQGSENSLPPTKTYWCVRCNRFAISADGRTPTCSNPRCSNPRCQAYGKPMVDNPQDSNRVESNAPYENRSRKPLVSLVYDTEEIIRKTKNLELVTSNRHIPVISNAEDEDLKHEVMLGLKLRGQQVAISLPEPRHQWQGRLDPEWTSKFLPILENCELAIYARPPGSRPNPATQTEINVLQASGKQIIIYEG